MLVSDYWLHHKHWVRLAENEKTQGRPTYLSVFWMSVVEFVASQPVELQSQNKDYLFVLQLELFVVATHVDSVGVEQSPHLLDGVLVALGVLRLRKRLLLAELDNPVGVPGVLVRRRRHVADVLQDLVPEREQFFDSEHGVVLESLF